MKQQNLTFDSQFAIVSYIGQKTEYNINESEQEFMKGYTTAGVFLCELFFVVTMR